MYNILINSKINNVRAVSTIIQMTTSYHTLTEWT